MSFRQLTLAHVAVLLQQPQESATVVILLFADSGKHLGLRVIKFVVLPGNRYNMYTFGKRSSQVRTSKISFLTLI